MRKIKEYMQKLKIKNELKSTPCSVNSSVSSTCSLETKTRSNSDSEKSIENNSKQFVHFSENNDDLMRRILDGLIEKGVLEEKLVPATNSKKKSYTAQRGNYALIEDLTILKGTINLNREYISREDWANYVQSVPFKFTGRSYVNLRDRYRRYLGFMTKFEIFSVISWIINQNNCQIKDCHLLFRLSNRQEEKASTQPQDKIKEFVGISQLQNGQLERIFYFQKKQEDFQPLDSEDSATCEFYETDEKQLFECSWNKFFDSINKNCKFLREEIKQQRGMDQKQDSPLLNGMKVEEKSDFLQKRQELKQEPALAADQICSSVKSAASHRDASTQKERHKFELNTQNNSDCLFEKNQNCDQKKRQLNNDTIEFSAIKKFDNDIQIQPFSNKSFNNEQPNINLSSELLPQTITGKVHYPIWNYDVINNDFMNLNYQRILQIPTLSDFIQWYNFKISTLNPGMEYQVLNQKYFNNEYQQLNPIMYGNGQMGLIQVNHSNLQFFSSE